MNPRQTLPGKHMSFWTATSPETDYPLLRESVKVDVAIVGGGIVGITAAFLLKRGGARVAVVEADSIARGVTAHSTAKLTSGHGLTYQRLIADFGPELARQYAQGNQSAIDFVEDIVKELSISCDFRRTIAYVYSETVKDDEMIQKEMEAAKNLGLPVSLTDQLSVSFPFGPAVRYDGQAQFHPRKYLLALAQQIEGAGSRIFENTRVSGIEEGSPCTVKTETGKVIQADKVIVATHMPFLMEGLFYAKLSPMRSYVLALTVNGGMPEGFFYCPTRESYHSIRPHFTDSGEGILLISAAEHRTGHTEDTVKCYREVEEYAKRYFDVNTVEYRWSTQDNRSTDLVPFVGPLKEAFERVFVATGFRGWGMTGGTLAAMILAGRLLGRNNPYAPVFDPGRRTPYTGVNKLIEINMHIAKQMYGDELAKLEAKQEGDLEEGQGALIEHNGEKMLGFKTQGKTELLSPQCSHMGCIVSWNNAEQTWDCPCHGSRFTHDGSVVHGPAIGPLEKKE